ncbi:MAG: hypothetical protein DCC55_27775 [Chloroflexi bacterium]|nr:MAG: hypothetical protein DCC55_27775 [Chloroflexota bacterium]
MPRRLTSLYGRTAEIEQVCNLLAREDCSLVTLVGEGGIGKTQLALATAEAMLPHFPDGIWLVDLAMLGAASDHIDEGETPTGLTPDGLAGDVAQRLASVVGEALSIRYQSSTNRMERLTAYLRTRRVLLILDGFEEHLDLAPALLTLLRNTAHTKALVTSRRPLNLLAEQRFQVDALALPEPSPLEGVGSLAVERLQHYAAVELFVARAQAIQPQFALTADNATCIVQICQWVGGTPLAIELAAAQLRHSTCAELLAALQQDYQILDTSLADLPERHRNMQRVLESSWRLLTADQARVLAACSIFQRRFSAAAAQAIVETTPQQLFSLVEHSVLRCEDGRRFELHDLVHHFAARHLASNEQAILRERHSRYYLSLLQEHTPGLAADIELFHTLRNEMDNIRAAWAWAVANQQVDLLVQSRQSLFQLYDVTALPQEAVTVVARAAAVVRKLLAEPNTAAKETLQILLAELILDEAHFHGRMARVQMATQLAQEALQLGESLRAPAIQARAAYELSYMLVRSGRRAEGTELARRGLVWARQSAPALEVLCHISLMASAVITSRNLEAVEQGRAALALPQIHAHPRLLAVVYTQLALPLGLTGEVDEAQTLFSQALTIHRQLEDRHHICRTLAYRAIQLFVLGAFAQAEQDLSEAITIADIIDDAFIKIMALSYLGLALTRAERADEGIGSAERAVELGRSLQVNHPMMKVPVTRAQLALGEILVVLGQPQAAYAFLQQGLALASELDAPLDQLKAHSQLAHCDLLTGKPVRACAEAEATLAVLPRIEDNQPFAVPHYLWKAYEVLAAYQHADADPLLRHLYDRIQQNAARIRNPALRRSYLEEVPANRAILALVAKQTATPV